MFPYFRTRVPTEMLFPPLGIASLAAQLRARGIATKVLDGTFRSFEDLRRDLADWRPDIVGVSSMVSLTGNTLRLAAAVRADLPDALVVVGGPLPTVFPGRYAGRVDAVFRGEADVSFPAFCEEYLGDGAGRRHLDRLALDRYGGLFVADHGRPTDNALVHHTEAELAAFPPPDRSQFDHAAYQAEWLGKTGSRVTSIMTTLGCPYGCDFCSRPVFGNVVRRRPLDSVFAEVEEIRALGYDALWIADDTFTLSRPFLEEFCRRIAPMGLSWSCLSRADGIEPATARLMKEAGCREVYLGLESGSPETLRLMNKQTTIEQGAHTAQVYRDAGIEVGAFFIVGYPGETVDSIEQTFRLALTLPLSEISFNVPVPLPGSALFERLGRPDEGRDWTRENEVTFLYPSGIDAAWLRRRVDETMAAFAGGGQKEA